MRIISPISVHCILSIFFQTCLFFNYFFINYLFKCMLYFISNNKLLVYKLIGSPFEIIHLLILSITFYRKENSIKYYFFRKCCQMFFRIQDKTIYLSIYQKNYIVQIFKQKTMLIVYIMVLNTHKYIHVYNVCIFYISHTSICMQYVCIINN